MSQSIRCSVNGGFASDPINTILDLCYRLFFGFWVSLSPPPPSPSCVPLFDSILMASSHGIAFLYEDIRYNYHFTFRLRLGAPPVGFCLKVWILQGHHLGFGAARIEHSTQQLGAPCMFGGDAGQLLPYSAITLLTILPERHI